MFLRVLFLAALGLQSFVVQKANAQESNLLKYEYELNNDKFEELSKTINYIYEKLSPNSSDYDKNKCTKEFKRPLFDRCNFTHAKKVCSQIQKDVLNMYCNNSDQRWNLMSGNDDFGAGDIIEQVREGCKSSNQPEVLINSLNECMKNPESRKGLTGPEGVRKHCLRKEYDKYEKFLKVLIKEEPHNNPDCLVSQNQCGYIDCVTEAEKAATLCGSLNTFSQGKESSIISCNKDNLLNDTFTKLKDRIMSTSGAKGKFEKVMTAHTVARVLALDIVGVLFRWKEELDRLNKEENSGAKLDLEEKTSHQSGNTKTETEAQSMASFKGNPK